MELIGKKFWHYRLESVLGEGGSAKVYRAVDERSGARVAVKILPDGMDRGQLQRFKQEATVLSQLDHPCIVKMLDIGSAEGKFFYVMESRPAKTLKELIEARFARGGRGFTASEVIAVAADVGQALECAHSQGIFHRDVKPSNILVTSEFRAILFDFGLAKVLDEKTLTQAGTLMGTPLYMSPEQLHGGDVDHRSDIYQLGLVLYVMIAGQVPFAGDNAYVSATRRLSETVPPPTSVRPCAIGGLEPIVMRSLARERHARYQSASSLLEDLARLSNATLAGPSQDTTVIRARFRSRRKLALAAAALLLALAGALGAVAGWDRGTEIRVTGFTLVPGRKEASMTFQTDVPLRSEVIFGGTGLLERRVELSGSPARFHRGSLEELSPGEEYRYRIRLLLAGDRMKELPERAFRTLSLAAGP